MYFVHYDAGGVFRLRHGEARARRREGALALGRPLVTTPNVMLVAIAAPVVLWWTHIGLHTIGVLDTDQIGYRAWLGGLSSFPHWFQAVLAVLRLPAWIGGVLGIGDVVTLNGRSALAPLLGILVGSTAAAVVLVLAGTWMWPDGPH